MTGTVPQESEGLSLSSLPPVQAYLCPISARQMAILEVMAPPLYSESTEETAKTSLARRVVPMELHLEFQGALMAKPVVPEPGLPGAPLPLVLQVE